MPLNTNISNLLILVTRYKVANPNFGFCLIFREEMEVGQINIRGSSSAKYAVDVYVRDEHSLLKAALKSLPRLDIMYMVEIFPPLRRNSIFVLPIQPLEEMQTSIIVLQ